VSGFKDFNDGVELTAAEVDGYLMRQAVPRFPSTTALLGSLVSGIREKGMLGWVDSTETLYMFDGVSTWMPMDSLWKSFTTVWSGPTPLAIGNGTLTCRWRYSGGTVIAHYELTRGSTSNAGSSTYSFSLPVQAAASNGAIGSGLIRDASPFGEYGVVVLPISSTAVVLLLTTTATSRASNTAPVTVATGDAYYFTVQYEPADGIS
jgi:hypothetical protein